MTRSSHCSTTIPQRYYNASKYWIMTNDLIWIELNMDFKYSQLHWKTTTWLIHSTFTHFLRSLPTIMNKNRAEHVTANPAINSGWSSPLHPPFIHTSIHPFIYSSIHQSTHPPLPLSANTLKWLDQIWKNRIE